MHAGRVAAPCWPAAWSHSAISPCRLSSVSPSSAAKRAVTMTHHFEAYRSGKMRSRPPSGSCSASASTAARIARWSSWPAASASVELIR